MKTIKKMFDRLFKSKGVQEVKGGLLEVADEAKLLKEEEQH